MKLTLRSILIFVAFPLMTANQLFAEEEDPATALMYYDLDPAIITNYQKENNRKLGYITVDVQFQVTGEESYDLVDHHKALIEDAITDVLNALSEADVKSHEKREDIRMSIKERVAAVLEEETGRPLIEDVLFADFLFQ